MERYRFRKTSLLVATALLTSSCASIHQAGQDYGTAIGCVGGAALGGGLTYLITGDAKKALAGGLVGGIAGCAVGNIWQNREKALAQVAAEEHIAISTRPLEAAANSNKQTVGLVAQVEDKGMFDTNSAQLSASGLRQVQKIAAAMKQGDQGGVILVVGHTDATGSAELNQRLSEQRAQNVGRVLERAGLNAKNLYFQGAGSSRPLADNTSDTGRAANRRVEITGLASEALLKQRLEQEGNNLAYLRYGATTQSPTTSSSRRTKSDAVTARTESRKKSSAASKESSAPAASTASAPVAISRSSESAGRAALVDFGGQPVNAGVQSVAANLKPLSNKNGLISSANASGAAMSCLADSARVSGQAKNLASGKAVETHETREYFTGMNGRAWAGLVNGHLVTLSPVKVLRDDATVTENPRVFITRDYQSKGNRKADAPISALANAWEGENDILYRVYLQNEKQQAISCIDLLVPKETTKAQQGQLFYNNHSQAWMAGYTPQRG